MQTALLVLNAGSSSLKFSLFSIVENDRLESVFHGQIEALDEHPKFLLKNNQGEILANELVALKKDSKNSAQEFAFHALLDYLKEHTAQYTICAAGHRVVHGGEVFIEPTVVNSEILTRLENFSPLAPLHQPYNIEGIRILSAYMPDIFQVACFDTAFHATQSHIAEAYALPENISPIPLKRYGFHGLSYEYIAQIAPHYLGKEAAEGKIIVAHLGHGASMCAMKNRQSIATTMGFTALDGLPMGTRCGNIDPGIILYLLQNGLSLEEITELLYKRSGLLGVSRISADVRLLLSSKESSAEKALEYFIYRMQRELGSLVAALDGLDSLIFTAGIGEHSPEIRFRLCEKIHWLPLLMDKEANQKNALKISQEKSKISIWVIPTNEELIIAQHTFRLWKNQIKN